MTTLSLILYKTLLTEANALRWEDFGLYEYAKMRDKDKLAASIAGLYSNVIREIGEQKKEEAGFLGIVEKAVSYLKKL